MMIEDQTFHNQNQKIQTVQQVEKNPNCSICEICCEKFSKLSRRAIICTKCSFQCCRKCCETNILINIQSESLETTLACCINCRNVWNFQFLVLNMSKSFMNVQLKNKIADILLMEASKNIPAICKKLKNITIEMNQSISKSALNLQQIQCAVCPGVTNLQQNFQCSMCHNHTCNICLELKSASHTCDQNIVANNQFIQQNCKYCPTCNVPIHKTEGCEIMFCIMCKTGFNWQTLTKIKSTQKIHNPHYFHWQFSLANHVLQPTENFFTQAISEGDFCEFVLSIKFDSLTISDDIELDLNDVIYEWNSAFWFLETVVPYIIKMTVYIQSFDEDLCMKYLKKQITQTKWKSIMAQRYLRRNKLKTYAQILHNVCLGLRKIIICGLQNANDFNHQSGFMSMQKLRCKANKEIKDLNTICNCKFESLNSFWELHNTTLNI